MTIPITRYRDAKTAKGLWRRIAIQVSKHRFYNRTGASEQTAQTCSQGISVTTAITSLEDCPKRVFAVKGRKSLQAT
mgnify:CR=1 FL=1